MARGELPAEDLRQLEAVIRRAGRWVQPSEDLRPKVLEAARERTVRTRARRRLFATAAAILVAVGASLSGHWLVANSGRQPWGYLAAVEVQRSAVQRSLAIRVDPIWTLIDIFREQRHHQAMQLAAEVEK